MRLLLPLALGAHAASAVGLQAAADATSCGTCYLEDAQLGANYSVVSYGNATADEFEWAGLVRDFVPQPLRLLSYVYDLNCSSSVAVLLNGTDVLDEQPFVAASRTSCVAAFAAQSDPGDYAAVVFLVDLGPPATRVVTLQTPGTGLPNAALVSTNPMTLALNGSLVACVLPESFAFCGATFTELCPAQPGVYGGVCATSNYTLPVGCNGDPLFSAPPLPPPLTFLSTAQGVAVAAASAVVSLSAAVTSSVAASSVSAGTVVVHAARPLLTPRRWVV